MRNLSAPSKVKSRTARRAPEFFFMDNLQTVIWEEAHRPPKKRLCTDMQQDKSPVISINSPCRRDKEMQTSFFAEIEVNMIRLSFLSFFICILYHILLIVSSVNLRSKKAGLRRSPAFYIVISDLKQPH